MDIGRSQNADPRWILPLLCRRGHITRNEVGAIRIGDDAIIGANAVVLHDVPAGAVAVGNPARILERRRA